MKRILLSFFVLIVFKISAFSQPIPVEFMAGNKYFSAEMVFSKPIFQGSKLGYFHLNTLEVHYNDKSENSLVLLNMLTYETIKNLKLAGGFFYGPHGFNPTAGIQYNYHSEKLFLILAPRVNIKEHASYDFITILQYKKPISEKAKLFFKFKMLNLFDNEKHILSYQWLRAGLDYSGLQFGLGANFDENGPNPKVTTNFGLFIRKEIF